MTRPPNKRVGRPRTTHGPVRSAGGGKKNGGCAMVAVAFPVIGVLSVAAGATGYSLLRAAVVLASYVFLHVSLAHLPAPRHRPQPQARAHGAAVPGSVAAAPSSSPARPALAEAAG